MSIQENAATITHPVMMVQGDRVGLLTEVSELALSTEHPSANPMLDEWIKLARAIMDVITIS